MEARYRPWPTAGGAAVEQDSSRIDRVHSARQVSPIAGRVRAFVNLSHAIMRRIWACPDLRRDSCWQLYQSRPCVQQSSDP